MRQKALGIGVVGLLAAAIAAIWIASSRDAVESPAASPAAPFAAAASDIALEADSLDVAAPPSDGREIDRDAVEDAASPPMSPTSVAAEFPVLWTGRVVDARRKPVAGVDVSLHIGTAARANARSGRDGRFELTGWREWAALAPEDSAANVLTARGPDGTFGAQQVWLPRPGGSIFTPPRDPNDTAPHDLGTLVLLPAHALDVSIFDATDAVEIEVRSLALQQFVLACAELGGATTAHFDALPAGPLLVQATDGARSASQRVFLPDESAVTLALRDLHSFDVIVVDLNSGEPIPGARLSVHETYAIPATFEGGGMSSQDVHAMRELSLSVEPTNSAGVARIEGLETARGISLGVEASGYRSVPDPSDHGSQLVPLERNGETTRIELRRRTSRTVRWPIVAGDAPVPADGSRVELRVAPGSSMNPTSELAGVGRMEGSQLVVEGFESHRAFLARADDGALARVWVDSGADLGKESSFSPPRAIEIVVRNAAGELVRGAAATARNQGNNPVCDFVRTDEQGRATLKDLFGELVDVHVYAPDGKTPGFNAGAVDLTKGDGRIDVVLPGTFLARASVTVDGEARLPARFHAWPPPIEEDAERAEWLFELAKPSAGETTNVLVTAAGLAPARAKVAPRVDGEPTPFTLEFTSAGELLVELRGTPSRAPEVTPESFDEKTNAWIGGGFRSINGLRTPNGPRGGFRFAGLTPGRWRVLDKSSGVASSEATIAPGALRASVVLEIGADQWVTGRVEAPSGTDLSSVVVVVDGVAPRGDRWNRLPGQTPPAGVRVEGDGSFKVRIPGDREVVVRPWHPWLAPDAESIVRTTQQRDGVVLKLVAGRELRLPFADPNLASARFVRLAAFPATSEDAAPRWIYAKIVDGVARTAELEPGAWRLWIDGAAHLAPLVLERVELDDGVTTLEPLVFSAGSSLRVSVRVEDGQSPPRIYVSATSLAEPKFWRDINSGGEAEVVLRGLSAGRYSVNVSAISTVSRAAPREIEVDGVNEVALDFAP
jgi:hypothetical protein